MLWLALALAGCLAARIAFLALHWNRIDALWYDFERRGFDYRIGWLLSLVTFLAYLGCAVVVLWRLDPAADPAWNRYGAFFLAGFGMTLLERFGVHRFPRLNEPDLYRDAQAALLAHLVVAFLSGLGMMALGAFYYWRQG